MGKIVVYIISYLFWSDSVFAVVCLRSIVLVGAILPPQFSKFRGILAVMFSVVLNIHVGGGAGLVLA